MFLDLREKCFEREGETNQLQIATPGHELYGSHLPQQVINAMIAPKEESSNLVMQWIESEGLGSQAATSTRLDSIIIEANIIQVEKLLKAKYSTFSKAFIILPH